MKSISFSLLASVLILAGCGKKDPEPDTSAPSRTPASANGVAASMAFAPPAPVPVTIEERIIQWKLHPADMLDEWRHEHRITRLRVPTEAEGRYSKPDAMEDYIRQRLHADPILASTAFKVDVDRVVATLTGKADSLEQVARAMAVVLATDGISEVISELALPEAYPPAAASVTGAPHG